MGRQLLALGWGSLIWSPRTLPVQGEWQPDGPHLPVEFSRQAEDGRITLAITSGADPIQVLWAELAVDSLDEAVEALGLREGIPPEKWPEHVGRWRLGSPLQHDQGDVIAAWAEPLGVDGVVWTALPTGFKHARGTVPTIDEILDYLSGLTGETRARTEEYIRKAPEQTRTAYRYAIEEGLGWVPL